MTILSRSANGSTYSIRSIAISTLVVLPLILGCVYILTAVGRNFNEDTQVLFFFFGVPLFVGCGFIATMLVYRWLYHQSWMRGTYRTAGLLAAVIAIPLEWLFITITAHFSLASADLDLSMIILGTWLLALPVTWMFFISLLRRRYNDVFTW